MYPGQYGESLRVQHIDVAVLRGHDQTADCIAFSIRLVQRGDACGDTLRGREEKGRTGEGKGREDKGREEKGGQGKGREGRTGEGKGE